MYTDDTNAALGLAAALVQGNGAPIDAQSVAKSYATFCFSHEPARGMPDSAKKVLEQVQSGFDIRTIGMRSFCMGSFANGAAMRIAPLGLVCLGNSDEELVGAVSECCVASHVHPEAIDAAVVQCRAVTFLLSCASPEKLDIGEMLIVLTSIARTEAMLKRLRSIETGLKLLQEEPETTDHEWLEASEIDYGFQLFAPDAVATVLWYLFRYHSLGPEQSLIKCVALGGDCDTTGAMIGALLGALHGSHWIPVRWFGLLENGTWGRDYIVGVARALARLPNKYECANKVHSASPVHLFIERMRMVLRKHFGWAAGEDLVDQYSPYLLHKDPANASRLWQLLYDALLDETTGTIRYDIATCVCSYLCEGFENTPAASIAANRTCFASIDEWNHLFAQIMTCTATAVGKTK
jgi:poly(ADP-ribose) glycohydrolase ARH3